MARVLRKVHGRPLADDGPGVLRRLRRIAVAAALVGASLGIARLLDRTALNGLDGDGHAAWVRKEAVVIAASSLWHAASTLWRVRRAEPAMSVELVPEPERGGRWRTVERAGAALAVPALAAACVAWDATAPVLVTALALVPALALLAELPYRLVRRRERRLGRRYYETTGDDPEVFWVAADPFGRAG
jgi:hypothetical protein